MMDYFNKYSEVFLDIVDNNIVWHDALTYHYEFDGTFPDPTYINQPE